MITILKPGLMTTLQDLGRYGHQKYGVINSGVMDPIAHRLANLLVGNNENEPTIEITLYGPMIRFEEETIIALCGGDLSANINGSFVKMNCPIYVRKGEVLEFGEVKAGCRTYLAIHGGFTVREVLGSKSTYVRAKFGGFEGRLLQAGDQIRVNKSEKSKLMIGCIENSAWNISTYFLQRTVENKVIRVMRGRQYYSFTEESIRHFFSHPFTVSRYSDRMGYRLNGPILELKRRKEMISEAVSYGTIQVPPEGNPIILLADRQTIGGYPKIAQMATVDFPIIAQTRPGESIYFQEISHDEAQRLVIIQEEEIHYIKQGILLKYQQGVK